MSIKNRLASSFVPFVGALGTISSTLALMREMLPCIVFILVGLVLLGYFMTLVKKKGVKGMIKEEWPLLLYAVLMLSIASAGGLLQLREINREKLWMRYIEANNSTREDELKMRADADDGPSQFKLGMRYYEEHDFTQAMKYFQRAGDGGNGQAYMMLSAMYAQGLGTNRDPHRAATSMIKARRTDFISDSRIRQEDIYNELTETEKMMLDETLVELSNLEAVVREPQGSVDNARVFLNRHHDELQRLSLKGYIPATEYLYVEEMFMHPGGSETLHRLAKDLYQVNHVPTSPFDRHLFFIFLRGNGFYLSNYQQLIRDNHYGHLFIKSIRKNLEDHSAFSNELLIKEYELFRAQLNWCKSLLEGEEQIRRFLYGNNSNDYQMNYEDAKSMLNTSILAIKDRMNCLEEMAGADYDLLTDYGFK